MLLDTERTLRSTPAIQGTHKLANVESTSIQMTRVDEAFIYGWSDIITDPVGPSLGLSYLGWMHCP